MVSQDQSEKILGELSTSELTGVGLRRYAMELLSALPTYNWSGIYRLEKDELLLDEYVGASTDHTRIPVGRGVCGTAVAENQNQVIEDVRELTNYLSCSTQTRSEIVVLIKRDDVILGQIDIDGHTVGAFDRSDENLLSEIGSILATHWS